MGKRRKNYLPIILVSFLFLILLAIGIFFSKNICCGPLILDDAQLRSEISQLIDESKLVVYPPTRLLELKQGTSREAAIGIKNLGNKTEDFSYDVISKDFCNISRDEIESWIIFGKKGGNLSIAPQDFIIQKISFDVPKKTPPCTVRYWVNVSEGGDDYARTFLDLQVKTK